MLTPPSHRARVTARAAPGDWAAACAAIGGEARALKDHSRGTVWRAEILGRDCVLKCLRLDTARRRLRALLRVTPARRHWRNARWLREHGFATAEVLAIVEGLSGGGERCECLVQEYLPGESVLGLMAAREMPAGSERLVADAVGRLASRLVGEGRFNRDAKPSNLIVTGLDAAGAHLAVIDCADLRPCRPDDREAVGRMLASAALEPMGCGCLPRLALRMRAVCAAAEALAPAESRALARRLWRRIEETVRAHGDPTPRDNPLGTRTLK